MKKRLIITLPAIFIIISLVFLLNNDTTTKQNINHQVLSIQIPLYLKILNFYDRHFNYKWMVERIIKDEKTEEKKVLKLFEWAYHNIKKQPADLPVVDDHVWHIIVRGYGTPDQVSDVFATLCNYVGIEAFSEMVFNKPHDSVLSLSWVKLNNKWRVFDPYNGVSFINKNSGFVSLENIKNGDWNTSYIEEPNETSPIDYSIYFENIPEIKAGLQRSNTQSPLNRLLLQIQRWGEDLI